MSVGIGIAGREVTFTLGASAVLGVTSKSSSWTNELGETTDDNSSGNTEFRAQAIKTSSEFSISGTLKNMELMDAFFGASLIYEVVESFPDGSTCTYDAALASFSYSAESNALVTYEASFSRSGAAVWTAGI